VNLAVFTLHATLLLALADAQPTGNVFHQSFEQQVPGQPPEGFRVTWRELGDTLVRVTNTSAATGSHAMLIDRRMEAAEDHSFSLSQTLPADADGWRKLSFSIRIDGKAADSVFSIDFGGTPPRHTASVNFSLRGEAPTVHLYQNLPNASWEENWDAKRLLAHWDAKTWYRVALFIPPAAGGATDRVYATLERRDAGGWKQIGAASVVAVPPPERSLTWQITCARRGYAVMVDDLTVEGVSGPPTS
jgi:hypothetical protein